MVELIIRYKKGITCRWWLVGLFMGLFLSPVSGQFLFRDNEPFTEQAELEAMMSESFRIIDSLQSLKWEIMRIDILEIDDQKYMLPSGRFDVYEWDGQRWRNLYVNMFHGYNFMSYKFVHDGHLYSYGGFGFWRDNDDLIKFLWDRGEWEQVAYENENTLGSAVAYYTDSVLFFLNLKPRKIPIPGIQDYSKSLKFNLRTQRFTPFRHPKIRFYSGKPLTVLESANYFLLIGKPFFLVDKRDSRFFQHPFSAEFKMNIYMNNPAYFLHMLGDDLVFYGRTQTKVDTFDLTQLETKALPMKTTADPGRYLVFILTGLLMLSLFGTLLVQRRLKKNQLNGLERNFDHPLIPVLLEHNSVTLSTDQLDHILGLEQLTQLETLRYRRSVLINEINLEYKSRTGQKLIQRIKDQGDKRRFLYRVG